MKKLIIIILFLPFYSCQIDQGQVTDNESLIKEVTTLKSTNDSLKNEIKRLENISNYWFDPEFDGIKYLENGIDYPEKSIKDSLTENKNLIPLRPILGGTMHFGNVELLGKNWLITEFDDGHIYGRGLYRYDYENGKLNFQLLDTLNY